MKKIIAIGLLLFFTQWIVAQNLNFSDVYQNNVRKITFSTPQSQIYEKYVNHKVQEYNGLPDISIPLGEISIRGINMPIVLSYHASGIKYMQMDGDVGAGWSINVGGYRISRNINGKCDFDYSFFSPETLKQLESYGNEYKLEQYLGQINTYKNRNSLGALMTGVSPYLDGEYDLFTYNTPTTNGNFIKRGQGLSLNRANDKIEITKVAGQITDDNGNKYYFGTDSGKQYLETTVLTDAQQTQEVGWPLVKMTNIYDESVNFTYTAYTHSPFRKDDFVNYEISNAPSGVHVGNLACANTLPEYTNNQSPQSYRNSQLNKYDVKSFYVSKIESPGTIVTFNRTAKNEQNSPNLLTSIDIKDINGSFIKRIVFTYRKSPEVPAVDQPWHYVLTSVKFNNGNDTETEKEYKFEYNEISMRYAYPDQWGYYNMISAPKSLNLHSDFGFDSYSSYLNFANGKSTRKNLNTLSTNHWSNRKQSNAATAFSLKKIIFPTGGYTEYEFEPHQYDGLTGGGLRVKTIQTKDTSNSPVLQTVYQYSNGIPSFKLNEDNFRSSYINMWFNTGICDTGSTNVEFWHSGKRIYSMNPTGDVPLSDFKVSYKKVTISDYVINSGTTTYNGSSEFNFLIPQRYNTLPMVNSSDSHKLPVTMPGIPDLDYNRSNSIVNVSEYALGYQPQLQTKIIRNNQNQIVQRETYRYDDKQGAVLNGVKVSQKVFFSSNRHETSQANYANKWNYVSYSRPYLGYNGNHDLKFYAYNYIRSFFSYMPYTIKQGCLLPSGRTVTTISYRGTAVDSVSVSDTYEYDSILRLTKTTQTNSTAGTSEKVITYPATGLHNQLITRNMLSTVITTALKNQSKEIGVVENVYPTGQVLPSEVKTTVGGNTRTDISYLYDSKGKIIQVTDLDGSPTAYLWGYNGRYPIAEIKNARYSDVAQILGNNVINSLEISSSPDLHMGSVNALRNNTGALKNALVTTYFYKPSVGILSVNNPQGFITYYDYDSFGRLKEIYFMENGAKRIVESYQYNYKK